MTVEIIPATRQTFITDADAYLHPGSRVFTEAGSGLISTVSTIAVARIAQGLSCLP